MPRLTRGELGSSEGRMATIEVMQYERLIQLQVKKCPNRVLHKTFPGLRDLKKKNQGHPRLPDNFWCY